MLCGLGLLAACRGESQCERKATKALFSVLVLNPNGTGGAWPLYGHSYHDICTVDYSATLVPVGEPTPEGQLLRYEDHSTPAWQSACLPGTLLRLTPDEQAAFAEGRATMLRALEACARLKELEHRKVP